MPRNALIQVRRDTAANWTSTNPTLDAGEIGFETDTGKFKIGTGSAAWTALLYATDASDITGATLASNVTGSSLTSVGTLGSLTVTGDVTVDTSTLKVDSTNNRVGIGVSSPSFTTDINGAVRSAGYIEKWSIGGAATGNITLDLSANTNYLYSSNSTGNWALNLRWDSNTSLNVAMSTGDSIVVTFISTQGASTFYNQALYVDSNLQTVYWQGGTAPSAGNTSTLDVYVYTVVKLSNNIWRVFGSQTKFDP